MHGEERAAVKTLYLVRHCAAEGQAPDAPLTAQGRQQALALSVLLTGRGIKRIVSSPFLRARQSIEPFADAMGLTVEIDDRLIERVLSTQSRPDWLSRLEESFSNLDLCLDGGESSRAAMARGISAVADLLEAGAATVAVTHGNLATLILKHFDDSFSFEEWRRLTNPDVYRISLTATRADIERIWQ